MTKYLKIALRKIIITGAIIFTAIVGGFLIAILPEPVEGKEEVIENDFEVCVVKDNRIVKCLSKVARTNEDIVNYLGVSDEDQN